MEYLRFIFSSIISLIINIIPGEPSKPINKILLIRLDHIGDMVCSLEAIYNIRREYNYSTIKLITGVWNKELFLNSSLVDEVIVYNSPVFTRDETQITSWKDRSLILKNLYKEKFDIVIDFRSDYFIMVVSLLLFPRLRRDRGSVRIKMKFNSILNNMFNLQKKVPVHETATNKEIVITMLSEYKESNDFFRFLAEEFNWFKKFLEGKNLKTGFYSVLHPGASWEYKRWDYKNFREIGKYLYEKYGLKSLIIGTSDEFELGNKISDNDDKIFYNIIGKTSLRQTMILLKNSAAVICNDSSPMQIASRMDVPTIAIMGPSEVKKFAPIGDKVIYFHKHVECNPCRQITCKYPEFPCVNLNSVNEVKRGIESLLEKIV